MAIIPYLVSILIANIAGGLGAIFTAGTIENWYAALTKPSFNPPNWIFGPVWTMLYTFMGIAAAMIYTRRDHPLRRRALTAYGVQLALNGLWTPLFFGANALGVALAEIIVLWFAILATIVLFWRIDRRASALLWPYLAWVSFATALNYGLWALNA